MINRKVAASVPTLILSEPDDPRYANGFHGPGVLWDKNGGDLGELYELGNPEGLERLYEPADVEVPGKLSQPFDSEDAEPSRPKEGTDSRFVDGVTFEVPVFVEISAGLVAFA